VPNFRSNKGQEVTLPVTCSSNFEFKQAHWKIELPQKSCFPQLLGPNSIKIVNNRVDLPQKLVSFDYDIFYIYILGHVLGLEDGVALYKRPTWIYPNRSPAHLVIGIFLHKKNVFRGFHMPETQIWCQIFSKISYKAEWLKFSGHKGWL
jgi:hypothetical protein